MSLIETRKRCLGDSSISIVSISVLVVVLDIGVVCLVFRFARTLLILFSWRTMLLSGTKFDPSSSSVLASMGFLLLSFVVNVIYPFSFIININMP